VAFFRFIHASDLHLAAIPMRLNLLTNPQYILKKMRPQGSVVSWTHPESHDPAIALVFAKWLYENHHKLHFALFTGDLATDGEQESLAAAAGFFEETPFDADSDSPWLSRKGGATLLPSLDKRKVIVLPGNHDRYRARSSDEFYTPGNEAFDSYFRNYWPRHTQHGSLVAASLFKASSEQDLVAIVSADFSLSPLPDSSLLDLKSQVGALYTRFGYGKVKNPTLDQLCTVTKNLKSAYPSAVILWAIHFCPSPRAPKTLKLIDYTKLIDSAVQNDIKHIFCGHLHECKVHKVRGVKVHAAATAMSASHLQERAFSEFKLEVNAGQVIKLTHKKHIYRTQGSFAGGFEELSEEMR
jgi:3',5'-cyclic AMP phosphodiesterase CpdA